MAGEKWYQSGLRFECTGCGNCCTGAPGYVWVSTEEIARIAAYLDRKDGTLPPDKLRRVGFKYSLTERSNGDCVFLHSTGNGQRVCSIYPVRPLQCRTWPFWSQNLRSPRDWADAAEKCPGMNNGKTYNFVAIEELRLKKRWDRPTEGTPPGAMKG